MSVNKLTSHLSCRRRECRVFEILFQFLNYGITAVWKYYCSSSATVTKFILDEPQPTDLKVQPFPSISPIPTTSDSVSSGTTPLCVLRPQTTVTLSAHNGEYFCNGNIGK